MAERRRSKRYPRRLPVRFGAGEARHSGFAVDISVGGIFVASHHLPPMGTHIHLEVQVGPAQVLHFEATVQRHRVVPPELRQVARGGFGARFLSVEELFSLLVPRPAQEAALACAFDSPQTLQRIYDAQLRYGGLFVRTERSFQLDRDVQVELQLPFAQQRLVFSARVVQVGEQAGERGVGLMFSDVQAMRSALARFLPSLAPPPSGG